MDRNPLIYHDSSNRNERVEDQFLANMVHFGRLLRSLGIPTSSQQITELARGVAQIDISSRDDFYYTSRAFLLHDFSKKEIYDQVFDLFWSQRISVVFEILTDQLTRNNWGNKRKTEEPGGKEFRSNIPGRMINDADEIAEDDAAEIESKAVYSPVEQLYKKDFSDLDESELSEAKKTIEKMAWDIGQERTRRRIRSIKRDTYMDFRRTIRNNMISGGEILRFKWHKRKLKLRPLIVICDVSGSMDRYSKIFLYFLYGLVQNTKRIESFVFGTRLTRVTHALRKTDFDVLFDDLSGLVFDWSSGTRIGESIRDFNFNWSRRILARGAVVVIISDGWDRGDLDLLEIEIQRLARSADRLIWLNPLAGSAQYEPLVGGIKTVLPHVNEFMPINNLESLELIAKNLGGVI